jgi:hypothetical protein
MLTDLQRPPGDFTVCHGLCTDDGGLYSFYRESFVEIARECDSRKSACDLVEPACALIANDRDVRIWQLIQDTNVVDAPVATTQHGDMRSVPQGFDARSVHVTRPASCRASAADDGRDRQEQDLGVEPERLRASVADIQVDHVLE